MQAENSAHHVQNFRNPAVAGRIFYLRAVWKLLSISLENIFSLHIVDAIFIVNEYNLQVDRRTLKRKSDQIVDKGCREKVSLIKMKTNGIFL